MTTPSEGVQKPLKKREKGLRRVYERWICTAFWQINWRRRTSSGSPLDGYLYEDAKAVCDYVEKTFGVRYTISGMRDLLHRLGFGYKQTRPVSSKADEAAQVEFLEETLPSSFGGEAGTAEVYFADGARPTPNTKTGRGWICKGEDFETDCNSGCKWANINARREPSIPNT